MAACPAAASSVPMDSKTISVTTNQSALAGLGGGSKGDGRLRPRYCLARSPKVDRGMFNTYPHPRRIRYRCAARQCSDLQSVPYIAARHRLRKRPSKVVSMSVRTASR